MLVNLLQIIFMLVFLKRSVVDSGTIPIYAYTNVKKLDYHVLSEHRTATTTLRNFYVDEWRHSIEDGKLISYFLIDLINFQVL